MTRRERMENRLQKRLDWAEKRKIKSQAGFNRASAIADNIPLGQPILVGHHSEKRHRRDLEKIDNGMRAGVENAKMADHHESKAAGIEAQLNSSIFSDDPDALEALDAKIARLEKRQELMKAANKCVRKKDVDGLKALGFSEAKIGELFSPDWCGRLGFPDYAIKNNNANIRRLKERTKTIQVRQARAAEAEAAGGVRLVITPAKGFDWQHATVTFAEKPEYSIITELKAAGFYWGNGSWHGTADKVPESVKQLAGGQS